MPKYWTKPVYELKGRGNKTIFVDVTSSVSSGLPPNGIVVERLIPFFRERNVQRVLDFGAGSLRHTFPLLDAGFEVCAVDYEEGFERKMTKKALTRAKQHPNFSAVIWPKAFISDKRRFDAALLTFVLQIMPLQTERRAVVKHIHRKLEGDSYLFYASRFNQITAEDKKHPVEDGYYRWPTRKHHSFYREFTTEETHELFRDEKFRYIRYLSEGGSTQLFLYAKGKGVWV